MKLFADHWQSMTKDRYTDRHGVTWQFDYYGSFEWFVAE